MPTSLNCPTSHTHTFDEGGQESIWVLPRTFPNLDIQPKIRLTVTYGVCIRMGGLCKGVVLTGVAYAIRMATLYKYFNNIFTHIIVMAISMSHRQGCFDT